MSQPSDRLGTNLVLSLSSCAALGKCLTLSVSLLSHLQMKTRTPQFPQTVERMLISQIQQLLS